MSTQVKEKPCKFGCNTTVVWKGKTGQPNSTGFFEKNSPNTEHTFNRCRDIKAGIVNPPTTASLQKIVSPPQNTGAIDPHLNSILIKISDMQQQMKDMQAQIMEIKQLMFKTEKRDETSASIQDGIAQKMELLVAKQGYPKPHMVKVGGTYFEPKEGEEDKEEEEVIDPKRLPKEALEENIAQNIEKHENNEAFKQWADKIPENEDGMAHTPQETEAFQNTQNEIKTELDNDAKAAQIFKEQVIPAMEKTMPESKKNQPWTLISEGMFMCNSCQTKSANGYEKYGTKICENCHNDIEETNQAIAYNEARDLEREEFERGGVDF